MRGDIRLYTTGRVFCETLCVEASDAWQCQWHKSWSVRRQRQAETTGFFEMQTRPIIPPCHSQTNPNSSWGIPQATNTFHHIWNEGPMPAEACLSWGKTTVITKLPLRNFWMAQIFQVSSLPLDPTENPDHFTKLYFKKNRWQIIFMKRKSSLYVNQMMHTFIWSQTCKNPNWALTVSYR